MNTFLAQLPTPSIAKDNPNRTEIQKDGQIGSSCAQRAMLSGDRNPFNLKPQALIPVIVPSGGLRVRTPVVPGQRFDVAYDPILRGHLLDDCNQYMVASGTEANGAISADIIAGDGWTRAVGVVLDFMLDPDQSGVQNGLCTLNFYAVADYGGAHKLKQAALTPFAVDEFSVVRTMSFRFDLPSIKDQGQTGRAYAHFALNPPTVGRVVPSVAVCARPVALGVTLNKQIEVRITGLVAGSLVKLAATPLVPGTQEFDDYIATMVAEGFYA